MVKLFPYIIIILFLPFIFWTCTASSIDDGRVCETNKYPSFTTSAVNTPMDIGTQEIKMHYELCQGWLYGYIDISILTPLSNTEHLYHQLGSRQTGDFKFTYNFCISGNYVITSKLVSPNGEIHYGELRNLHVNTPSNYTVFNITEAEMSGDTLWSYFVKDPINNTPYYDIPFHGSEKAGTSFDAASTSININNHMSGKPHRELNNQQDLFIYVIDLYGNNPNVNVSILLAIDDADTSWFPKDDIGLNFQRTPSIPSVSCIAFERIRNLQGFSDYEKLQVTVGATIHELGHATGILYDKATIYPPHRYDNGLPINPQDFCIMESPVTPESSNNAHFCQGHIEFINGTGNPHSWLH